MNISGNVINSPNSQPNQPEENAGLVGIPVALQAEGDCRQCPLGPQVPKGETVTQNYLMTNLTKEQSVCGNMALNLGNVIAQGGFHIVYNPSDREILLQHGTAFYITYKVTFLYRNCRNGSKASVGIEYQKKIYPGSISEVYIGGNGMVELSSSVIMEVGSGIDAWKLVNRSSHMFQMTALTVTIIQLS